MSLLKVEDLKVHFPMKKSFLASGPAPKVRAVDGVTLNVEPGEILGLVGESGCGKSTLGRAILQLYDATSGRVEFDGADLTRYWAKRFGFFGVRRPSMSMRKHRRQMQMIFQDPYSSLDPRMTVEDIIGEPFKVFTKMGKLERRQKVQQLMAKVGLDPRFVRRYPHEFSGGQCQRIGIARAIALEPKLIIADEPISALDVSIQAQILNLLKKLQQEMDLTIVFIAHDLAAVRFISQRVAVMYLGQIVEIGPTQEVISNPQHPYTKALLSAVPRPDPDIERAKTFEPLQGDVPSPVNPPSGCHFHPRCPVAVERCKTVEPKLSSISAKVQASCHLLD